MMRFHHTSLLPGGTLINIYQMALGGGGARICSTYHFLWCKYSHCEILSYQHDVSECEFGRDTYNPKASGTASAYYCFA